jgi:hypothetical protein
VQDVVDPMPLDTCPFYDNIGRTTTIVNCTDGTPTLVSAV